MIRPLALATATLTAVSATLTGLHFASHGFIRAESYLKAQYQTHIEAPTLDLLYTSLGVSPVTPTQTLAPLTLEALITEESSTARVNPLLLKSLIEIESGFRPDAINFNPHLEPKLGKMRSADHGLTQVNGQWLNTPTCPAKTWPELYDPRTNIKCGLSILKESIRTTKTLTQALTIYNCGHLPCPRGEAYADKVIRTFAENSFRANY